MAGKRSATSDLNYDNWNQEEEPEERGSFQKASDDALKNRVIKTARRRNPIRPEDDEKKSAFVGFTGFSSKPASTDFSFLKDISKSESAPKTNGIDQPDPTKSSSNANIFNTPKSSSASIFGAPAATATTPSTSIFGPKTNSTSTSNTIVPSSSTSIKKSENFCSRLKGLNESVSKWIVEKVEENSLISLQPIFKDYEKYLKEIEKEESSASSSGDKLTNVEVPTFNFTPTSDKNTKAIPDSTSEKTAEKKVETTTAPTFQFGAPSTTTLSSSAPTFSFGSANNASGGTNSFSSLGTSSTSSVASTFTFASNTTASGPLSFLPTTQFNFGGVAKSKPETPKEDGENNDNDEDEPPKVEFKAVVEKDHLYTIRCKVFVKKGDGFGDRGVGNLYLKPIENSEKVQLIVRADTNLGNLLLNFILSESVPTKRMGKKDVMLVAIPTPDSQPPPTPILVRVKSPEDADNLLQVLEKHKK